MSEKKPTTADILEALKQANEQNAKLRELLDQQAQATATYKTRLSQTNTNFQNVYSEVMVGIRSASDNTVGIPGAFGQPPIQLHANSGAGDPGTSAVISYAWWRELRKSPLVRNGLIYRDDSVVGPGYGIAPEDRPEDLPPEHALNLVVDPRQWIDSRDEAQLRADIAKITSHESLQRLRRAVDDELRALENQKPRHDPKEQAAAAKWALSQLAGKYVLVDNLTTTRIERLDEPEESDGPLVIR